MLSPSDFNNAVPQFTNGNYASNPINPQYVAEPDAENYNKGTEPLQTLPAQWWNWFLNKFTGRFNKVNVYVKNIFNELAQILSIFNITPDGTEATPTTSQLKTVFESCYPQYVKTAACLVGTETTVNGHPLSSNVTVTKSDLGLGTSATLNTGTAVGCIPTVGTALGTTNNNILVTDSTGKLKPSGITVGTAAGCAASCFRESNWIPSMLQNTSSGCVFCAWMAGGNSINITPNSIGASWINWIGGSACTLIGDGTGCSTLGTLCACVFCGTLCGNATCADCAGQTVYVQRNPFDADYIFDVALLNGNDWTDCTPLYVGHNSRLTFNTCTGVLTAKCFNGDASATYALKDNRGVEACFVLECGNALDIYSPYAGLWINYLGGASYITVGDGAKGCGTVIAACFCGTATRADCAACATCATEANCSQAIKFIENAWCGFCSDAGGNAYCCVCNKCNFGIIASLGYLGLLAIPANGKCNLGAYLVGSGGNGIRCY